MPGPLAKSRVLMFGNDEALLHTRSKVLATIGCESCLFHRVEDIQQELTSGLKPALLLICHTTTEEASDQVRNLALKTGVPTYYVERLLPPQQLVGDVSAILKYDQRRPRAASGQPYT